MTLAAEVHQEAVAVAHRLVTRLEDQKVMAQGALHT